ncbi:MAG: hypothetical protein A2504_15880 [Bdellovibrionales bacterium RIFOXYD12_FULL_39_22]|nr:MAG: hypothetical protein A2385_07790 [Bdellovibrionales bacterium RIFOXYB1_FULL_39_21]OFZ43039.1 MAG: hypothetical protein A2485_11435 [Bdellovibrionales bacterium RIFOXYC12_FULL_39_17]OFZ50875.1 MAG: hypothetical protein A2404_06705 [Bdellovibrionales bacterium RIFOXYC1_FULL_39_130]OFZ71370.1 MAG: hypothetical protein A2451_16250 [Bdellovibrionales bacterium RIFOXYC2_FULL_39_8]OFZ78098.1 MAG: hypothetical protein A2560_01875 [Bdellovibrionales bacterium RIFOXYD1_FULL_39_84]OFZ93966.1 MAG:
MIRFIILALLSLFFTSSLFAQTAKEGYYIYDKEHRYLKIFNSRPEMIIDLVSSQGYELYGPDGLGVWLKSFKGLRYNSLAEANRKNNSERGALADYQTPEQIGEQLKMLQEKYPEIISLTSIGKSVLGRPIWAVKISDNAGQDEIEPEFKYIANMHGDEIVGRELLVKLIADLAMAYYDNNERIISLINNTEIYLLPSINPDGNAKRQRGNANYRDLNRSFPDFTTSDNQNISGSRPAETVAVMNFQKERNFALSANFHDGAVVVNYPWDTKGGDFQFQNLIVDLSAEYARNNSDMRGSGEFNDGITNGYDWYEVNGGMQDWSYYWHGDMQITLEFSLIKWPRITEISRQYNLNKESMIQYMRRIHQGAGVYFADNQLSGAITIYKKIDANKNELISSFGFSHGEFYKVLDEGEYLFEIKTTSKETNRSVNVVVKNELQENNGNYIFIN